MSVNLGQNPFKGLYYYEEKDKDIFYGRDKESEELSNLVELNRLTVVFGKSGIGKTSLLNAGLFPLLRDKNFLPVRIRLDYRKGGAPLLSQVKQAIRKELEILGVVEMKKGEDAPADSIRDDETLWEYFHRVDHLNKSFCGGIASPAGPGGDFLEKSPLSIITPILVFDQFEEFFPMGKHHPQRELLVEELYWLVEDQVPAAVKERILKQKEAVPYLRAGSAVCVVLGLREDYLPHLNGLKQRILSIHRVMFRVIHLNGFQAREVLDRSGAFTDEAIKKDILDQFYPADMERGEVSGDKLEVEPALFSLLCYQVYEKGEGSLTRKTRDEILTDFYDQILRQLPRGGELAEWIESHLLTEGGYRTPFYLEREHGMREVIEAAIDKKLLRKLYIGEKEHVEIIHDVLATVINERKKQRSEKKKRMKTRFISTMAIITFFLAIFAFIQKYRADEQKNIATQNEQKAVEEKKRADAQTQEALKQKANATQNEQKAVEEKKRADKEARNALTQKINAEKNERIALEERSKAEAKELATRSIVQRSDKKFKAQLAIRAYKINKKAYIDTVTEKNEPAETKTFKPKDNEIPCPPEIFEALRLAYIANNENDIYLEAESWALATLKYNKIIYTDNNGKLALTSILQPTENSKLPGFNTNETILPLPKGNPIDIHFFVETETLLYCISTNRKVFYWEKNKNDDSWGEVKELFHALKESIFTIAYSGKKNSIIYSTKDALYIQSLNPGEEQKKIFDLTAGNFINAAIVVEDEKNAFVVFGDKKGRIFYCNLEGNSFTNKELNVKYGEKIPSEFYSATYNPNKKLLAFGDLKGAILLLKDIDCQKLLEERGEINPSLSGKQHKGAVKALAFDSTGRYLASGGLDGVIMLWGNEKESVESIISQMPDLTIDNKSMILSLTFESYNEDVYLIYSDEKNLKICPTKPSIFYNALTQKKEFSAQDEGYNEIYKKN